MLRNHSHHNQRAHFRRLLGFYKCGVVAPVHKREKDGVICRKCYMKTYIRPKYKCFAPENHQWLTKEENFKKGSRF
jgi:hypothetical protein